MCSLCCMVFVFFFKQKTAYDMRISDWSSDVCSSDLDAVLRGQQPNGVSEEILVPAQGEVLRWKGEILPVVERHRDDHEDRRDQEHEQQIGRESCRERVCQYV